MKKLFKQNNGITLIALVITIIVMLILVSVTISMAVNGGLFGYAGRAARETEEAKQKELDWLNVEGLSTDQLIAKYIGGGIEEIHNWTREGDTFICTCSQCNNLEVEMGQIIEYTPNTATTTCEVSETDSGTGETQEIERENLTWIVLGIEDKNGNGTNETLLITSATPTNRKLRLYGAAAYNNGPGIMNKVCKDLYSSSTYGQARSMTIEDVNKAVGWTDTRGMYYDTSGTAHKVNANTKFSDLPPEVKSVINGTNTPDGTSLDNYIIDGYYYYINGNNLVDDTNTSKSITEREKAIIFNGTNYYYWLASRGSFAYASYDCALFGPGYVCYGYAYSYNNLFNSNGYEGNGDVGLRPVVSLTSGIPTVTGNLYGSL